MKIHTVKKPVLPEDVGLPALFPVHPSDVAYVNKQGDGEILQVEAKKDRFYPLTKKYWALCNLIAQNSKQPGYEVLKLDSKEAVDEHIKLTLKIISGYIVYPGTCKHCGGEIDIVHVRTGSISNMAKDKDEFQTYYDKAVQVMSQISGISVNDLELNWMQYECEVM